MIPEPQELQTTDTEQQQILEPWGNDKYWCHERQILESQTTNTTGAWSPRSTVSCRLWLQYRSLVAHGSSLQYLLLLFMAPVLALSFIAPVSSICCSSLQYWLCRSWLQYLSFVAPVSSVVSLLQSPPVSPVARGSGSICISCHSWLRVWSLVAPVAPVSPVVRVSCICHSRLRYLLSSRPVAPVSPVVARGSTSGSSICCVCLQYHYLLLVAPVAPVFVACGSCCSCCFNRQPSSVLVIFL